MKRNIKISIGSPDNVKGIKEWHNVVEIDDGKEWKPLRVTNWDIKCLNGEVYIPDCVYGYRGKGRED